MIACSMEREGLGVEVDGDGGGEGDGDGGGSRGSCRAGGVVAAREGLDERGCVMDVPAVRSKSDL